MRFSTVWWVLTIFGAVLSWFDIAQISEALLCAVIASLQELIEVKK